MPNVKPTHTLLAGSQTGELASVVAMFEKLAGRKATAAEIAEIKDELAQPSAPEPKSN